MNQGLLFVGHGTRSAAGLQEFGTFVTEVESAIKKLMGKSIETYWLGSCFLELKNPTIAGAIGSAVEAGCQTLIVVPIFLFSARHIKSDIPSALSDAQAQYPGLSISCLPPLGSRSALVETCVNRIFESGFCPDMKQACLVFVCRGGGDEGAREAFLRVVQKVIDNMGCYALFQSESQSRLQCGSQTGIKEAYLAGEGPRPYEVLVAAKKEGYKTAYIVPILLFQGQLILELNHEVQIWNENEGKNGMHVTLTSHLGPHSTLIRCVANYTATAVKAISTLDKPSVITICSN